MWQDAIPESGSLRAPLFSVNGRPGASFAGDFPDPERYAEILGGYDLSAFPRLDKSAIAAIESALSVDIPRLVAKFDNPF